MNCPNLAVPRSTCASASADTVPSLTRAAMHAARGMHACAWTSRRAVVCVHFWKAQSAPNWVVKAAGGAELAEAGPGKEVAQRSPRPLREADSAARHPRLWSTRGCWWQLLCRLVCLQQRRVNGTVSLWRMCAKLQRGVPGCLWKLTVLPGTPSSASELAGGSSCAACCAACCACSSEVSRQWDSAELVGQDHLVAKGSPRALREADGPARHFRLWSMQGRW